MSSQDANNKVDDNSAARTSQEGERAGHVSPQIDESRVKPDEQIAQAKEQSSGQGSGQT